MANECLVTKLKGVVNNDNLMELGSLRVKVIPTGEPDRLADRTLTMVITGTETATLSVIPSSVKSGGHFNTVNDGTYPLTSTVFTPEINQTLYFEPGEYALKMTNKYNIVGVVAGAFYGSVISLDIADIKYSKINSFELVSLTSPEADIDNISLWYGVGKCVLPGSVYGDITNLGDKLLNAGGGSCNLTILDIQRCSNVFGSINSLGKTSVQIIWLNPTQQITGSIEEFVSNKVDGGHTSDCTINRGLRLLSFGGVTHSDGPESGAIHWESKDKISVYNQSSSIVYTKGYTQAEAESAYPGYTIIRVDA